jgi:excisionase family DNA binding protein
MPVNTPAVAPRLLDINEAAKYLSASVWEIRKLVHQGKLPGIKLGRKYVFDRVMLDKFVDGLVKEAA